MRLIWQVTARGIPDYKVSLVLRDAAGRGHADGDHEPYHGQRPTSAWPFGELTYEPHDLLVDPATPPGTYTLGITVYDPATGETYPRPARPRWARSRWPARRRRWTPAPWPSPTG